MTQDQALILLNRQLQILQTSQFPNRDDVSFAQWRRDTTVVIEQVFGAKSTQASEFAQLDYKPHSGYMSHDAARVWANAFARDINQAKGILASMINEATEFWQEVEDAAPVAPSAIDQVKQLCGRFHRAARQLRSRYNNRPTLEIEDEYDVQNLFHALLKLFFDDVRDEEWTPSYAGNAARTDFLLRDEQLVVEVKKTRQSLTTRDLADQLIIDSRRYKSHPNCKALVCFVYDPEGRIGNPYALENDLSGSHDGLDIIVIVAPKDA